MYFFPLKYYSFVSSLCREIDTCIFKECDSFNYDDDDVVVVVCLPLWEVPSAEFVTLSDDESRRVRGDKLMSWLRKEEEFPQGRLDDVAPLCRRLKIWQSVLRTISSVNYFFPTRKKRNEAQETSRRCVKNVVHARNRASDLGSAYRRIVLSTV